MLNINLIVQYYKVTNSIDVNYRQNEIDTVLKLNCNNIYITNIYLLLEDDYDLSFLKYNELRKIKKVIINRRLKYSDAFNFYNENLKNQICILSNADIYFDESIQYLNNINWSFKLLISPTRYEHYLDSNICILYGNNQNLKEESPWVELYDESVFTQDCWIWCCDNIDIKNSDFNLGTIGCDNLIAHYLHKSGYTIISSSKYICVNHFDHLSENTNKTKGKESFKRENRVGKFDNYKFIKSGNYFIDKNITSVNNYNINSDDLDSQILYANISSNCKSLINNIYKSQIIYSSKNNKCDIQLNKPFYWEPTDNDKIITIKNNFLIEVHYIDIQGLPLNRNNIIQNCFVTKLQLFYSLDGINYKESNIYDGIMTCNYEYIKRIYLKEPLLCYSIRIKILEYNIRPCIRLEIYYKSDNLNELNKQDINFKNFVYNCQILNDNRKLLRHDEIYNNNILKIYRTNIFNIKYNGRGNDMDFFKINNINSDIFWNDLKKTIYDDIDIKKNILNEDILDGICIFTYVMNRRENLIKYMNTWLNNNVNQIIILDWSSNENNYDIIESFNDPRIMYIRVENEPIFIRTYAQNLAARFCKYNRIIKLDSDITITDDFFEKNKLNIGEYIAGNFVCARNENEKYTHGNVYLWLNDYFKINGYNELITTYGNDDSDFYFRLQILAGLKEKIFDLDTIYHNPHNEESRKINMNIYNTNVEIFKHRYYLDKIPLWNQYFKLNQFNIQKINDNYFICIRNTFNLYNFTNDIEQCEIDAINNVYSWYENKTIQLTWDRTVDLQYKILYLLLIK